MLALVLLKLLIATDNYRLTVIDGNKNELKTSWQVHSQIDIVNKYFDRPFETCPNTSENGIYFMLMTTDTNKMAAFAYIEKSKIITPPSFQVEFLKKFQSTFNLFFKVSDVFSFFSIVVPTEYRGKNLCRKLMFAARDYLNSQGYKNYYFALHLSSEDKLMPVAAKIYYSIGFKKFSCPADGPYSFFTDLTFFQNNCADFYEICQNPDIISSKGHYLASIIPISELAFGAGKPPANFFALGLQLMKIMKDSE